MAAVEHVFSPPLYEAASVRQLFALTGAPNGLFVAAEPIARELSEFAKTFALDLWTEVLPSTPEREKQTKRLAQACAKVLEIAGLAGGGSLLPMFAHGGLFAAATLRGAPNGEAEVLQAFKALALLHKDASLLVDIESRRRRSKQPKAGHPKHRAMQNLICDLSRLYETAWGRAPGISSGGNEPSGPFMRLLVDVTNRLQSRGLRFSASRSALRQVWRRLPDDEKMPITWLHRQVSCGEGNKRPLPQ